MARHDGERRIPGEICLVQTNRSYTVETSLTVRLTHFAWAVREVSLRTNHTRWLQRFTQMPLNTPPLSTAILGA